jgi:drug/metabolite transporter (DMT)-like permease
VNKDQVAGRWYLGFGLALFTAYMWGVLPVILKGLLGSLDAYTLTWFRFTIATCLLMPVIVHRYGWQIFRLSKLGWGLVVICVLGATSNYVMYLTGLKHITPGSAQVVIQLAPMFMLLGGLVIFKESFGLRQWFGLGVLVMGIALFFNPRFGDLVVDYSAYDLGVFWVAFSALSAATYALVLYLFLWQYPFIVFSTALTRMGTDTHSDWIGFFVGSYYAGVLCEFCDVDETYRGFSGEYGVGFKSTVYSG